MGRTTGELGEGVIEPYDVGVGIPTRCRQKTHSRTWDMRLLQDVTLNGEIIWLCQKSSAAKCDYLALLLCHCSCLPLMSMRSLLRQA